MDYPDTIDFLFELKPHGWSVMSLHMAGDTHTMLISSAFGSPLDAFIQSLTDIALGEKQSFFAWYDEPGGVA